MGNYDNFVFYGSWRETLEEFAEDFGKEYAQEALWNLMLSGTAGDMETSKKSIIGWINGSCMDNINSAKDRYAKAVENGKKGGRPTEVDTKQIAELKKETYVMNFLDYIQQVYYDGKEFSANMSSKLITILNKIGTENLVDAINFFYEHDEEFDYVLEVSGKNFVNSGYKLGYLLGIWYNSYNNGYVYIKKQRTNYEIAKEVC